MHSHLRFFKQINWQRKVGNRGPSGIMIWLGITTATVYGFYQIGVTNEHKRHNHKEKREARMAIVPYLMVRFSLFSHP